MHFDVGFLGVHVAIVVGVVGLYVAHVVRLRYAVDQVTVQLVGVTQNLRWYDRSVAAECLKRRVHWNLRVERWIGGNSRGELWN